MKFTQVNRMLVLSFITALVVAVPMFTDVLAVERDQATIYRRNGLDPVVDVWIDAHTIERLVYGIDEAGQTAPMKSEDVARVEYAPSRDPQVLRALSAFNSNKFAEAVPFFERIINRPNSSQYAIVRASIDRGIALRKLGRTEDATKALREFLTENPQSYGVLEAYQELFATVMAAKNLEKAQAVLNEVETRARKEWFKINKNYSAEADILIAYGRAKILSSSGEHGQAATALDAAIAGINPQDRPELWRDAALLRAKSFQEVGDGPNAIRSWQALVYQPIGPRLQGEALLALAEIHSENGESMVAFDYACRAAVRQGASGTVMSNAKKIAKAMAQELSADESIPVEIRKVYSQYSRQL